jgi:hypothetical protein
VNWVDPLGLSFLDPSWAHKAIDRLARGADKIGNFVSTHKKAVITAAVIIATLPLDETGIGEVIDADVATAEATTDVATDVVADEVSDEAAEEVSEQATDEEAEQAADESLSCGGQSFTPDTEVQLANGAKIPISQVRVGDMVMATDTATGKTQAEPVTTLWVNHDDDLMDVTVKTASGTSTIKSTQHHLFWDLITHAWVQADDLTAGTALQTPTGVTATVVATTIVPGSADMWDLTVTNDHDFYVVVSAESQTAVLVHNCPTSASDDRAPWQLTREGSSNVMRGGPFNTTFYQSASDNTWWTTDIAGHADSAFKVYQETSTGLQWVTNADEYGDYIEGMWKGSTGRFIPWSQLAGA